MLRGEQGFHRSDDYPECGQRLAGGKRCARAPAWPTNLLKTCEDCDAARASKQIGKPVDEQEERAAIVAEGRGSQ